MSWVVNVYRQEFFSRSMVHLHLQLRVIGRVSIVINYFDWRFPVFFFVSLLSLRQRWLNMGATDAARHRLLIELDRSAWCLYFIFYNNQTTIALVVIHHQALRPSITTREVVVVVTVDT